MSDREDLEQLDRLHADGMLSDEEHAQARQQMLGRLSEGEASTLEAAPADEADDPGPADEAGAAVPEPTSPSVEQPALGTPPSPSPAPLQPQAYPAEPAVAEPAARARRWRLSPLALAAVTVALTCIGVALIIFGIVGGGSSSPSGIAVNGIVAVTDHTSLVPDGTFYNGEHFGTGDYTIGKGCHTLAGYQDITGGASVVISDSAGKVLARTQLRAGVFDANADCVFGFTTWVPTESGYQLTIGQRSSVQYPASGIADPQLVLS